MTEVPLSLEQKLKNIEETEAAKKRMLAIVPGGCGCVLQPPVCDPTLSQSADLHNLKVSATLVISPFHSLPRLDLQTTTTTLAAAAAGRCAAAPTPCPLASRTPSTSKSLQRRSEWRCGCRTAVACFVPPCSDCYMPCQKSGCWQEVSGWHGHCMDARTCQLSISPATSGRRAVLGCVQPAPAVHIHWTRSQPLRFHVRRSAKKARQRERQEEKKQKKKEEFAGW